MEKQSNMPHNTQESDHRGKEASSEYDLQSVPHKKIAELRREKAITDYERSLLHFAFFSTGLKFEAGRL